MKKVCIGGTFDTIHSGHQLIIKTAFLSGMHVVIGLTSDEMARIFRSRDVNPYDIRKKAIEEYCNSFNKSFEIVKLFDRYGPSASDPEIETIVVSEETKRTAEEINLFRIGKGLPPLNVIEVVMVNAYDEKPLNATRIARHEIDEKGNKTVFKAVVGSINPVKVQAVKSVLEKYYPNLEITAVEVNSGVPEQPFGSESLKGALNRAKSAIEIMGDANIGIGIEAGLMLEESTGKYLDVQYCAIIDKTGKTTFGHGPGFYYPDIVIKKVLRGKTVGEVMSEVAATEQLGKKQGAIGYLTQGVLDRKGLTESAVLMAMTPRLRHIYDETD